MKLVSRFKRVFGYLDARTIEVVFLTLTFGWGTWIILPWDTFHTSPSYRVMAAIGPEWGWGFAALAIGSLRLSGLLFNNLPLRILAAGGGCGIWWTTWVGIAQTEWRSIGVPVYFVLSSFCGFSLWELVRQYRRVSLVDGASEALRAGRPDGGRGGIG